MVKKVEKSSGAFGLKKNYKKNCGCMVVMVG